jgi:butyrate kinase
MPSRAPELAAAAEVAADPGLRRVVLVEGESDRVAVRTLADRLGRDLDDEGVRVVAMGGATSIAAFLDLFAGRRVPLGGLYDAAEQRFFAHALQRTPRGADLTRDDLARRGFHCCDADLEDELVRALGVVAVEAVVDAAGELGRLRTFQQQPAQRSRTAEEQLHRFIGTRSGRKIDLAARLTDAVPLADAPEPLLAVLTP